MQSSRQFQRHATAIQPFETSSELVTDRWFGLSRNPMYLSMLPILTGAAMLLATFREAFMDYRRSVRRWL